MQAVQIQLLPRFSVRAPQQIVQFHIRHAECSAKCRLPAVIGLDLHLTRRTYHVPPFRRQRFKRNRQRGQQGTSCTGRQQLLKHSTHIGPGTGVGSGIENVIDAAQQQHKGPLSQRAIPHLRNNLRIQTNQHSAGGISAYTQIRHLTLQCLSHQGAPSLGGANTVSICQAVAQADQFHSFILSGNNTVSRSCYQYILSPFACKEKLLSAAS